MYIAGITFPEAETIEARIKDLIASRQMHEKTVKEIQREIDSLSQISMTLRNKQVTDKQPVIVRDVA